MPDINNPQNNDNNNLGSPFIYSAPSNPRNINYGINIAQDFPYDPWKNYEPLFDMYPRYKPQIQEALNRGIPRRIIEKVFRERVEPKLNYVGTPDQVKSFLGLNETSQQRLRDYNEAKLFQTYREAFPDKSDQEISDAFAVSQSNGLSPQALLQYPKLMEKIVNGRKLHEGYIDSVIRGGNNLGVTLYSGYIGMKYFLGAISKEEANKQWADADKYVIPEPINTDFWNRFLAGGANVTAQGVTTMAGGAAGAKIGAWVGGLIGGPAGAVAGGTVGAYLLPALEMFTLQAGNDMREFANKTDLNGQPIDENAARIAAGITGLITTATEMFTLKKAMGMFPGANKLFGWNKESIQGAITIPSVNEALSKIAEDFFSSLNWSTAHNVIESAGTMLGDVLSEYFSGQPFPQKEMHFVENIIETIINSYRDFTASGLVNAIPRLMGLAVQQKKARNVQQGRIREFANFMGVSTEGAQQALNMLNEYEYEKGKSESDSENKQQDIQPKETQSDVQQDTQPEVQTEVIPEAQQENQQVTQSENQQEAKQKSIHDYDYIYLPKSELQNFIQDNHDFADIHGIDSDSETALTPEQFERITTANPDFINSIMNDIRFGSNGMTIHEAQLKLDSTDPEQAEFFHSQDNQKFIQDITQQYSDAGIDADDARDLGLLWGALGANFKVAEGFSIKAPDINQLEDITQVDYSRLSTEYDINNPDTWPDRERAEKFKEAVAWGKLPEAHSLVQNIFDYLRGKKPERADELQPQSDEVFSELKHEAPDKVKSTRNELAKQELDDYRETLRLANLDTINSLNLKDNPDPARYEFNSQFPKGKSKHPTEQYYFGNFDGETRIDVATDGTNLKVRIKTEGNRDTAIFAIKNYRSAVLADVIRDVLGGFSIDGIKLSETPAAMYLSQALRSFWDKFGLRKANINTTSYTPNLDVQHLPLELVPKSPHGPDYDRDNSVVFDEDYYSPDYEHNEAVLQDIPSYEDVSPETKRENMPETARFKLAQDEQAWHKTVDSILADEAVTTRSLKQTHVMMTPLVLTLVGAKHTQMNINNGKLKLILRDHKGMTPDVLKDIPRSITDPIAIFESTTRDKSIIILTDLKDDNDVEVLTAVNMNQRGEINKIDSAYSKSDKKGNPKYTYYQDLAVQGHLLYLNNQKAALWAQSSGVDLSPYAADASTEADLISLWNKHKENGYYYTDKNGNPIAFTTWKHGRAVIKFLQNTHIAANVHEFGHAAFFLMQALEKAGSVGMRNDIDIILKHAGVSRTDFDADVHRAKGGAREIAQEYFAKAWEKYMLEGKAPNKKLQPVFTRIRDWLRKIYDDVTNQLKIEIDDEVRGVFDRLFGMDEDSSASIADIVQNELRIENQIKAYEAQQRELLKQQNEFVQLQNDYDADPHMFDIDQQAAQNVDEIINLRDWYSTIADEMQTQKENIDYIVAAVKQAGRITYQSIEELAGKAKADEIYSKWGRQIVFKNSGIHIDDVQGRVEHTLAPDADVDSPAVKQFWGENSSNHGLLDFLDNNSPIRNSDIPSSEIPAHFPVDTNLVNALLAAEGVDTTVDYLEHRKSRLENEIQTEQVKAEITEIDSWLAKFKAAGSLDEELSNPSHRKRKKQSISKKDLRRTASTAAKMGQQLERLIQDVKAFLKNEKQQKRFDEKIQALKQAREADRAKHKERLERITQALQDRADNKLQKKQQQFQRKIDSLQERINNLRNARDAKKIKSQINRMVKSIVHMSNSKSILVDFKNQIQDLLNGYNLSRKGIKHRDKIRKFFNSDELPSYEQLEQNLEQYNLTREDLDAFLDTIHIEDMTIQDISNLHQKVSDLFTQGREEYKIWKQQRDNTRADYHNRLIQPLLKLKAPDKTVVTGKDDINKQFSKVGDMANQFWDSIQTPGRFLDSLGEDFRRLFDDEITSRRDKLSTWVHKRKQSMLQNLKQLGLSLWDFAKPAITIDGKTYSWTEVHAIWNAFKNEKSKLAVLWGNFIQNQNGIPKLYATQDEAMSAINQIFELMHQHPEHIKAAELIIQELEQNFERLHEAGATQFNTDIHHEENYTVMNRLRHESNQGLVDAETENLAQSGSNSQILQKVENGFTKSRVDINPMFQQPINLDAWSNWLSAVTEQEYYIHLAGYASDLLSALLMRDENGNSVVDLIKSRRGVNDWNTLKSIFNDSITDKDLSESEALNKFYKWALRARSFAYIPLRPVTSIVQSASYLTAFPYTSHGHLFRTLAKFTEMCAQGKYNEFMENVFQKAGELRFASGDFADETYRRELMMSKSLPAGAKAIIDKYGYAGVRFVDRTTKALVFHAAYESNIENGMSEEDAVRLANRAVRDTQPASTTREATRLNRKNGLTRLLLTQFMAPLAPVFNMAVVDVARALAHPSWNNVKAAACFAISAGMTMLFSQFLRDLAGRRLPNGEEDDYGNVATWGDWIANGLAEGFLGSLPILNNSFLALYRMLNGRKFNNENRLDAPFIALGKAANYVTNDDYEGQYNDKAVMELVKALALFGVPLPYAAIRDIKRIFFPDKE